MVHAILIWLPLVASAGTALIGTTLAALGVTIGRHRERRDMARLDLYERKLAEKKGRESRSGEGEKVVLVRRE